MVVLIDCVCCMSTMFAKLMLFCMLSDILMWEELHPKGVAPVGRGYHTFTAFSIHVLLVGEKGDKGIISSDAISVYDAEANMWMAPRVRGTAPVSRSNHAAALVKDDLIFMCGGRNGSERFRDICLLQQMVDSLKVEVNSLKASIDIKDLLESELIALQQNIQLLQNQYHLVFVR
ncbi:unnamed protein product [Calypogeia fissa]